MIDSLEITNWKTHKKTELKFQKGVNVLIGIMGAGKSSVVDAITFGLFGTFPALTSKKITLSGLITNRPSQESEAEVKLGFVVDQDKYTVTRKIGQSGNSARIDKNGNYMQTQPTKVTEEVENALKIDYDTFSRVVYAEQNRLDYFLDLAKGERKRQIDHMLGLDSFTTAEENSTSLINNIKGAINAEESSLQQFDLKEMKEQSKKLASEKAEALGEIENLTKKEKDLKTEVDNTRKELESAKKKMEKKRLLSEEAAKLESRISTLNEEIKKIEAMKIDSDSLRAELEKVEIKEKVLSKEIEETRKSERELTRKLASAETDFDNNKRKAAERDRLIEEIKNQDESETKKELERTNTEFQELVKDIGLKKGKAAELASQIRELEKHISKCPICERELSEEIKSRLLEGKKSMAESIAKEVKQSEKDASERTSRINKLTEQHNRLILTNKKLTEFKDIDNLIVQGKKACMELKRQADSIQKESEAKEKEHNTIRDSLNRIRTDIKTAERRKSYELEVKEASSKRESRKKEASSIEIDDKAVDKLQERLTSGSATLSEASSRREGNEKLVRNIDAQIKDKEKQIVEYEKIEKGIEKRRSQINNLNKFKGALQDTEAFLRNRLVSSINEMMQDIWPKLYPYGDYANIRLNAKKDDYLLEVNTGEGKETWIQVDGIASGGERSIGCLAMRISLAMVVVPNLKWLILDEPTHNLDSTGISKLIEILGESLPGVVDQIFIITHDDNMKQIASAKVYQFDRDKSVSAPTSTSVV